MVANDDAEPDTGAPADEDATSTHPSPAPTTQDVRAHRFEGDVAVVTGSTRGIGEGIARRLAAEGASVVVTGRPGEGGEDVADAIADLGPNGQDDRDDPDDWDDPDDRDDPDDQNASGDAVFVEADVRDPDAIAALMATTAERFGGIDVLVNNAGIQTETSTTEAMLEDWNAVVETDFRAYWLTVKHASQYMDVGAVVNVSSNHAIATMPSHFPYNAVKAGIDGMTRAMALDLGPAIRVNTVNPGWVLVDRTRAELDGDRRKTVAQSHPVGRLGQPGDVAAAVAYLASDEAGFVTGANLVVDGGRTAVLQDDTLPTYGRD